MLTLESVGNSFEYFVKWFLKNDPEWSTQVDQVWLWDEYPDNWDYAYEALKRYVMTYENLSPKRTFKLPNGERLLYWIQDQQANRHNLSEHRIKSLESIPNWSCPSIA